jgi:2-polyprenyl-3-methyl-5-hydroxy-6-metoxy-1,4-benzoquinol methylase
LPRFDGDVILASVPHKVIDLFDRLAPGYDTVLPFFDAMAAQVVSAIPVTPGMQVLDLGAGIGGLAGRVSDLGARATAIDAAPAMVAGLRRPTPR